jgi:hypothetical protein
MPDPMTAVPKPATGCVGFGCAFTLSSLGLFALFAPTSSTSLATIVVAATVLGLLTARFGEPFFEKLVGLFRWF